MSALSPSQQPNVLFSIYQNNTWTIRSLVTESIDPATQRIILKIVGFIVFRSNFPWFFVIWGDVGSNPSSGKWFFSSQSQPYLQVPINFWMEWIILPVILMVPWLGLRVYGTQLETDRDLWCCCYYFCSLLWFCHRRIA